MKQDKKEKSSERVSESVKTPEPPQVIDPSKSPAQKKKPGAKKNKK